MKRLITLFLLLYATGVQAQQKTLTEKYVTRFNLNLLGFSFTHERSLGQKTTVLLEAGTRVFIQRLRGSSDSYTPTPFPQLSVEGRWYYNLAKKLKNGRNIRYNRGGFIGMEAGYLFNPFVKKNVQLKDSPYTGIFWGLQEKLATKMNIEIKAGYGLIRSAFSGTYSPERMVSVKFGFILAAPKAD
jgi:hypothetical protein